MLGKELLALACSQPSLNLLPIRFAIGSDNFEDACYFIRIIGRHYNKRYAPTAKNAPVPDLNLSRIHLQQTAALLTNWPENFRIFLRAYAKLDNPDPEFYVRSPQLKSLLKALIAFNSRAPVSTETMNLLSELEPVVWDKRHYGLYPKPSIPGKYVHITAFAKKMHVSKQTIEDLIDSGELNAIRRPRGNRQFILIPTTELKQAQSALTDRLSHKETAQLLGISRKRLSQLREARIFRAGKIRAGAPAQYSYKQIHQFMAQFQVLQKQPKCTDPRSLKDIAKYIASSDYEFIAIVRAVVDQQLHIVHHNPVLGAIAGVHISQAALDEWRDRRRKRVLRIDDVAKRLGFKQEVAYHLVRKGLIKSSVEKLGRRLCRIVLEEDLEQFTGTYISAVEMAKLYGTSPKHLVNRLFRRLIHPETGPKIDGGRQYFYLRLQLRYSDNVFGKSRVSEWPQTRPPEEN
jgi:predicted DNA-binding transcriptional regulator AlpA